MLATEDGRNSSVKFMHQIMGDKAKESGVTGRGERSVNEVYISLPSSLEKLL